MTYQDAPPRRNRSARIVRELVETILLTVVIFFLVRLAVQNFRVQGTSMLTTVKNNDLVLVNKFDYLVSSPHTGDIIVFHPPVATSDYIKRIIGMPGDTIRIRANLGVWRNGKRLNEPYENAVPNYNWGPATVPPNEYFVLGDNRNGSYDSHAWCGIGNTHPCSDTWVQRDKIIGKALVAYWPLSDFSFFGF